MNELSTLQPTCWSFGIGSFHFEVRDPNKKYSSNDYKNFILNSLEAVDTITNLEIEGFESYRVSEDMVGDIEEFHGKSDFTEGPGLYPQPIRTKIEFDILVPKRIQEKIAIQFCGCEQFHVTLVYDFRYPVAIISSVGSIINSPSDAVFLVRKYLESILNEESDSQIQLACIGPSPFHADFFVSKGAVAEEVAGGFLPIIKVKPGYHEILIITSEFSKKIRYNIQEWLAFELGFFYEIVSLRNAALRQSVDLMNEFERFRPQKISKWNFWKAIQQYFQMGESISRILFCGYDLELLNIRAAKILSAHIKDSREKNITIFLKEYCDDEIAEIRTPELEKIQKLVQLFEERRKLLSEHFMLIISAVLGGAVGAAFTKFFS